MLDHQHIAPPGVRLPMDLSSSQFHDQPHQQMPLNPVFLNPINMPFPGPEKGPAPPQVREGGGESPRCKTLLQVGQFPLLDPRLQYLQWASNPLTNPYLRTPHQAPPLAPPYLQGLQQFQHLKTLQQNLAKTLLASQAPHHSNCELLSLVWRADRSSKYWTKIFHHYRRHGGDFVTSLRKIPSSSNKPKQ